MSPSRYSGHSRPSQLPPKKVAVVASLTWSLVCFRLDLLRAMIAAGHEVTAFAPDDDIDAIATLEGNGIRFIRIPMARKGTNPLADIRTFVALYVWMRRLSPDIVLAYTMKPIIYGSLAARLAGIRQRFAMFTGLGFLFGEERQDLFTASLRRLSIGLHKMSLAGAAAAFAYNETDAEDIRRNAMVGPQTPVIMLPGSGVDLDRFVASEPRPGAPVFLLIARLLREKGIGEYVAAARVLKREFPHARFQVLGPFDPGPLTISKLQMDEWVAEGIVDYLGETRDVRPFLTASTIFVLPSYYREGIPRSALEAMAVGRAIITTDAPGCRETVREGENGLCVPPRDVPSLVRAMRAFLEDETLARRMGAESRKLAEERFDVHVVNGILLDALGLRPLAPVRGYRRPLRIHS